ncbi:hypothetical protein NitYY0826_C0023 [Nitratiruptor sp. YY08-26]|uniref:hypothetical protein n=1 Tax=unclassified Nitratiruptor TaxID=2624044 RepID=UPI0019156D3E|nr:MULTISPECIES: hypothetical protein [unclassified Nitratiruptor]BCD61190.1 hypothetical protein NitYY0813_C0023 [Nitratiruptor sp. YY08-13]BCD65123.1 hypothetical protein NitYY0826_C0023 [Nitratiruptor sp. YY08-26]
MRGFLLILFALASFAAESNKTKEYFHLLMQQQNPYVFDKKARLELQKAKIAAQVQKEKAQLDYKKAVETAKIKKESIVQAKKLDVDKEKVVITPQLEEAKIKKSMVIYFLAFGVLTLILIYIIFKRYQAHKEKLELERLRIEKEIHEKELAVREQELRAQMAAKLMETLASGKLTKEQEEQLLLIAKGSSNLLEKKN